MSGIDVERVVSNLTASVKKDIAETPVDVLIMGPNVNREELPGAKLRKEIIERCLKLGWLSMKAEHQDFIDAAGRELGESTSLCTLEMALATVSDAVIIVAASEGSFAEFGLFAVTEGIRARILVLLNSEYEEEESYLKLGPARSLEERGGAVEWVDYTNIDETWDIVKPYIEAARRRKLDRLRLGGR
jgi:hypothetical protein